MPESHPKPRDSTAPSGDEVLAKVRSTEPQRKMRIALYTLGLATLLAVAYGIVRTTKQSTEALPVATPKEDSPENQIPVRPATVSHQQDTPVGSGTRESSQKTHSTQPDTRLSEILAKRDPVSDGWDTEVLNEVAEAQLKLIGKLISHPEQLQVSELESLSAAEVAVMPLRPAALDALYSTEAVSVFRAARSESKASEVQPRKGRSELLQALEALATSFSDSGDAHTKFKIVRVEMDGNEVETVAYYQANGTTERGIVQQNATWTCRWNQQQATSGERPTLMLAEISAHDFSEVVGHSEGQPLLADCTESVLGGNPSFDHLMMKGTNHWRRTLQSSLGVDIFGHQGLAIGDANGDGLEGFPIASTCSKPTARHGTTPRMLVSTSWIVPAARCFLIWIMTTTKIWCSC